MSGLPPEADMLIVGINVCYVPIADLQNPKTQNAPPQAVSGRRAGEANN